MRRKKWEKVGSSYFPYSISVLRHAFGHTPYVLSLGQETNSMQWSAVKAEPSKKTPDPFLMYLPICTFLPPVIHKVEGHCLHIFIERIVANRHRRSSNYLILGYPVALIRVG